MSRHSICANKWHNPDENPVFLERLFQLIRREWTGEGGGRQLREWRLQVKVAWPRMWSWWWREVGAFDKDLGGRVDEIRRLIGRAEEKEGEESKVTPGFLVWTTEWMFVPFTVGAPMWLGDGRCLSPRLIKIWECLNKYLVIIIKEIAK